MEKEVFEPDFAPDMEEMLNDLNSFEEIDLPEDFHKELMLKISKENKPTAKIFRFPWKSAGVVAASSFAIMLVMTVIMQFSSSSTATAPSQAADMSAASEYSAKSAPMEPEFAGDAPMVTASESAEEPALQSDAVAAENRLAILADETGNTADSSNIRTYTISIEVKGEEGIEAANAIIDQYNQYIANRDANYSGYYISNISLKVPNDEYYAILENLSRMGKVVTEYQTETSVFMDVADTKARLTAKETEYDRIYALLERAETVEDMLKLEQRINDITYEIEGYKTSLNTWNKDTNYPLINIQISGTDLQTPVVIKKSLGDQMSIAFKGSINVMQILGEGLAVGISYIFVPAVLIGVLFLLIMIFRRRRK